MRKTILTVVLSVLTYTMAVAEDNYITVTPVNVEAGEVAEMTINLINQQPMTAFQMQIDLPEGFTFHYTTGRGGKVTYSAKLTERADDHTLTVGVSNESRTMRAAALSGTSTDFYQTNENDEEINGLLTVKIVADNNVAPGLYQGTVKDIKFTENVHEGNNLIATTHKLDPVQFTILVKGDGTAVTLNVSSAGVATLILPFDAALPDGLQAWRCESVNNEGAIRTRRLSDIPANTPLLITGTPGMYEFNGEPTNTEQQYTAGVLTGTYELMNVTEGYVLQKHGDEVAFYRITAADGENVLPYRCYLTTGDGAFKSYCIRFDDETGIGMLGATDSSRTYDLSGRVTSGKKGIRIINHNKVISK